MLVQQRKIGEIFVERGFVSQGAIDDALENKTGRLGEYLLEHGVISDEQLAQVVSEQYHIPYVDLVEFTVSSELFAVLSPSMAQKYCVVPYKLDGESLVVAISDVNALELDEKLAAITRRPVKCLLSSERQIRDALKRSEGVSFALQHVSEEFKTVIVRENQEGQEEIVALESIDEEYAPVIKLVNSIILAALQKRASDIHIETYEHGVEVKYRIDGVLYHATDVLDKRHHSALISRLKVMAELDIAEKRIPQDGRFKLRINQRDIDFRVSVLPTIFGEDVVIRILDKTSVTNDMDTLSLDNLGISQTILQQFRKAVHEPYGMVLITGPTGSGKTTTLYAALSELNSGGEKIITIEDPVEYQLEGVIQIPVNEKKELTFSKGLRSILRHDPDKIMVGEIRDVETAKIAVQSALTGHLVFTTVHANNAFDVINRFSHMGVDVYNLVTALNCVMAQRLVRRLCVHCKQPHQPSREELASSGLLDEYADRQWYTGAGCPKCLGTGYYGRLAITELLMITPEITEMILKKETLLDMKKKAIEQGMETLRQTAIQVALAGETSLAEINRVTFVE